jgi:beta-lactamase regulating signal transducer with metallopeptidase domain
METLSRCLLTFLLNAIWQIPLVAAAAALICRSLRRGPARHRHTVYAVALLAAVILPLASLRQWTAPSSVPTIAWSPQLASVPQTAGTAPRRSAPAAPASSARTISLAQSTAAILLGAYLLVLLFRIARLARAWRRTTRIRDTAQFRIPPALVEAVSARCRAALGVRDVEMLSSTGISGPVTAGGAIILPASLLEETSEDVLTAAIGHEMAHIVRRDFAFNLFCEAIALPVSFHPATRILLRGIERTREMACDEVVTERLMAPGVYARAIMKSESAGSWSVPRPA